MVKMKLVKLVPLVLAFVLLMSLRSSTSFTPVDNYLIACGSSKSITFQGRTLVPDTQESSLVLKSANSVVASSNSNVPSPIYQSARVFEAAASYKFKIQQEGRHWVRLYFHPLTSPGQNLESAQFSVVTDHFVLLTNFTFKKYNGSYLFKEYAINVTSDTLTLTLIPSNNSVAFVNAIEVVSIPDALLPDQAYAVNPSSPFSGLSDLALQTVYRLNMGGPLLTAQNDTLGRTWENDQKYLHVDSSAVNVAVDPTSIKYPHFVKAEIAPNSVYATAQAMRKADVPNTTWVLPVDPNFLYLVRVHFCDIVSKALNSLAFNVYLNSDNVLRTLNLSSITGDLRVPYYKDFVSNSSAGTLTVNVGPDSMAADNANAILNALEVFEIGNELRSSGVPVSVGNNTHPSSPSKKNNIGIIVGSSVGAVAFMAIMVSFIAAWRST